MFKCVFRVTGMLWLDMSKAAKGKGTANKRSVDEVPQENADEFDFLAFDLDDVNKNTSSPGKKRRVV